MNKKVITICLIERLNSLLETALHDIQTELIVCNSKDEVQRAMEKDHCSLILIDASGITTERAQRSLERMRLTTYAPILVLASDEAAEHLLESGADMCLSDTMPPESVVPRALALLRRSSFYNLFDNARPNDAVLHRGDLIIDPARHRVTLSDEEIILQRREFRLLLYFARNPGIVITPEQICEKVWMTDSDYGRDISPVISGLRRKLGDSWEHPRYIETVYGIGYRFLPTA